MGYIDPGLLGMLSQVGYLVLFAVVSGLMFELAGRFRLRLRW